MNEQQIRAICEALVSICEYECCVYGFEKEFDMAYEYINTYECKNIEEVE